MRKSKKNLDSVEQTVSKPNIFLDLDQTVISAETTTEDEKFDWKKHKDKAKKFRYKNMEGYYIIFERPGLQKFLDFLFANFNVSIWTAASKDYALFIIEKIILNNKKNRKLDWIFFSYHCDISKLTKKGTKDLSIMWNEYNIPGYTKDNSVIIDDNVEVYNTQTGNCIIASPFEFTHDGSENDHYLYNLQPHLDTMKKSIQKGKGKPAVAINNILKV